MATKLSKSSKSIPTATPLPEYYTPFITQVDKIQKAILFNKKLGELDIFLNSSLADIPLLDIARGSIISIKTFIISLNLDPEDPYFGLLISDYSHHTKNSYVLGWLDSSIRSYPKKTWHGDYDFRPFSELLEAYYNS